MTSEPKPTSTVTSKTATKEAPEHLPKPLTAEEVKALAGDLAHGEVGFVELDDKGKPTGPAKREMPPAGKAVARVVGVSPAKPDGATTPTGAPLTAQMNPDLEMWDAGMLERNPPPPPPKPSTT